jgi:hypothetical protein
VHRQLRALTILDALISNAGTRFQRTFSDEALLERLRICASDSSTDPDVKAKLKVLVEQWAQAYSKTQGLQGIARLHNQFPRKQSKSSIEGLPLASNVPSKSTTSQGASSSSDPQSFQTAKSPSSDTGSSWRSHKKSATLKSKQKRAPFNLDKEKPALNQALANASITSTNLINSLKLINREKERPSEKKEVLQHYHSCKNLQSSILRYIQHVESEEWLGSLIHAHEELSSALELYQSYDKPIEDDSDSDSEDDWNFVSTSEATEGEAPKRMVGQRAGGGDHASTIPRGGTAVPAIEEPEDPDDPDDPFGNQYEVYDVSDDDRSGIKWKVV